MLTIEMIFRLLCAIGLACLVGHLDARTSKTIRALIGVLSLLSMISGFATVHSPLNGRYVDSGVFAVITAISVLLLVAAFNAIDPGSSRVQFWRKVLPFGIIAAIIAAFIFGYSFGH